MTLYQVQPYFRHTYMCHAQTASALKYFLQRPDVVDWRKPATFTGQCVIDVYFTSCEVCKWNRRRGSLCLSMEFELIILYEKLSLDKNI